MSTLIEQTDGESDLPAALASSGDMGFDQQVTRRGVTVRLHDLVTGAVYNGATGIVQAYGSEEEERERCAGGRQPVMLQGSGKVLKVRPNNLAVVRPPLSVAFVQAFRRDLASGDAPMPMDRDYLLRTQAPGFVTVSEHACRLDVQCCRCKSRSAPLYLVLEQLASFQLLAVECTDCAMLIAAEEGVPAEHRAIAAFNDSRYKGCYSAIKALQGQSTGGFFAAPVHPPGLPGPLHPGISEQFYDY
jgi:hypothetical protein